MILTGKLTRQINENFLKHPSVFAKQVLKKSKTQEKDLGENCKCWKKIDPPIASSGSQLKEFGTWSSQKKTCPY